MCGCGGTTGLTAGKPLDQLVFSLLDSGLLQVGGVLTTDSQNTGQQWDSPNAWAPLVLLTVEGLRSLRILSAEYVAVRIWQTH